MKESREFSAWGATPRPLQASRQMHPNSFGPPDFGGQTGHQTYAAGQYAPSAPQDGRYAPYPYPPAPSAATYGGARQAAYAQEQQQAQYGQYSDPAYMTPPRGMQTKAVLHGFGAVLSLALMIGSAAWVWQLTQRDVAGVPVVRALEGPLRVAPENPGGRQAAHQGLSVNELAASQDISASGSIMLAPASAGLSQEDGVPAGEAPAPAPTDLRFDTGEVQPIQVALQQALDMPAQAADPRNSAPLGFVSATRRAVQSSPRPPRRNTDTIASARAVAVAAPAPAPSSAGFAADDLAASVAQSVAAGIGSVRDIEVDPASLGPGTRLVQLGAYDDAASARAAWDQLSRRFSPLLDDRGRVIEAAQSGGSVFYRLRAHGFNDERDARRFCAALVDQQIDCIPVLIR
ncbi:sporulation related protein [Roseinatronobacter thiooxidans]|uniref:Sporulation related protein n=1 Tax=Roseinatronobacter thiooxidans TaxID=121821 RepID=A0A2W7QIE4_9RHOB|nr:SPOR domain-containing protein [Roseinatronobacter thiooxidans]PZX48254.1 sporulation related protein [Roseinatronobacter thiooxidans]